MVNWAHVHLMINHVPVIGVPGAIILFLYALARKSEDVKIVSLGVFMLIALLTIPVFFTGMGAENVVKNLPGVTETYIGRHEEVADLAVTLMAILGVASLAGLFITGRSGAIPKWLTASVLILAVATAAVVLLTANLGGQIRHTEIRDGFVSSPSTGTVK